MECLDKTIDSAKELNKWIRMTDSLVIYGAGDYGKQMTDYLFFINEDQRIKKIVVTEKGNESEYRGKDIWSSDEFLNRDKECIVLIAVSSMYQKDIIRICQAYDSEYYCMTERLYYEIKSRLSDDRPVVPYKGIDFLCAGFGKCGTTSLFSALRGLNSIYLSDQKENHFLQWCESVDNAEQLLIDNFFDNIRAGQKVGMIDPTYAWEAKRTCEYLGNSIKIIFMVRNPADAAFSGFKMAARQGRAELDSAYKKNGGQFSVEIFENHFTRNKERFLYIDWIREFERYFGKEQLKIVFLEELIGKPRETLNNLLDFIGTSERYAYETLPLSNEGGFVMADLEGYQLARLRLKEIESSWNKDIKNLKKIEKTKSEIEKRSFEMYWALSPETVGKMEK